MIKGRSEFQIIRVEDGIKKASECVTTIHHNSVNNLPSPHQILVAFAATYCGTEVLRILWNDFCDRANPEDVRKSFIRKR
jgi:hypothetical protein